MRLTGYITQIKKTWHFVTFEPRFLVFQIHDCDSICIDEIDYLASWDSGTFHYGNNDFKIDLNCILTISDKEVKERTSVEEE